MAASNNKNLNPPKEEEFAIQSLNSGESFRYDRPIEIKIADPVNNQAPEIPDDKPTARPLSTSYYHQPTSDEIFNTAIELVSDYPELREAIHALKNEVADYYSSIENPNSLMNARIAADNNASWTLYLAKIIASSKSFKSKERAINKFYKGLTPTLLRYPGLLRVFCVIWSGLFIYSIYQAPSDRYNPTEELFPWVTIGGSLGALSFFEAKRYRFKKVDDIVAAATKAVSSFTA